MKLSPTPQPYRLTIQQTLSMTGCLFDGHLGQYIYDEILDLARSFGWPDDTVRDEDSDLIEYMIEASEEAIDWLNEHIATDGWHFDWYDGEFFYNRSCWFSDDAEFVILIGGSNYGRQVEMYESLHDAALDWITMLTERVNRDGLQCPLWGKGLHLDDVVMIVTEADGEKVHGMFTYQQLITWAHIEGIDT